MHTDIGRHDFTTTIVFQDARCLRTECTHGRDTLIHHFTMDGMFYIKEKSRLVYKHWRIGSGGLEYREIDENHWRFFDSYNQKQWTNLIISWFTEIALLGEEK